MEVDKDHSMRNYGSVSLYFGRWLLYVTVGVVQGIIVTAGDIFLPGVQCTNPAALILTGAVCSFVYVNIIYALSLTFKHIGKALCVILVILQIPGSSGTYPIEMTPAFFQNLHPLLPFTYGITAMRECIAGMYGSTYIHNLLILLLYVPISLLIGLGIRPLLSGLNRLFDQKLAETELMIGETPTEVVGKKLQLSMLLSASLSQEELQIQTASKAQAFEKNYQKMIKIGFLAILIVPLIFLILMFSLESKLVFLVLWILSIILIATWLIIVEYFHSAFANQQKLAGMSFNEMLESSAKRRRSKTMKNIFQIFYHDIKKIRKNVIALIVILGITIVPSLYAWFNIAASWDPYGNTGDLKVAIASQDKGYDGELIPVKLNLGDQILSELHENTQLNWVFTNAKDAKKRSQVRTLLCSISDSKRF